MVPSLTMRVNVQVHPFGTYQTQTVVRLAPEAEDVREVEAEILPPTSAETQLFGSEPVRILES